MKSAIKIFALFAIILISSCKKDFKDRQDKTVLLTKPTGWVTVKIEQRAENGTWNDITSDLNAFAVDNLLIFDPYYVWAINEGPIKFPGNPQIVASGSWRFTDDATKIQFVGGNLAEITELTETSLQYIVTANGATNRFTYKHP
ncbi:hypothetical protein WG904_05825 [Pedobacter sp. Du54]|uniref:hypothetical protein n=1 Tax=Pedobacter anseongensis TaxID=3133439 RepID=UPI0030A9E070